MNKLSDQQFLFIIGRGRSGTDLFKSILNAHPDIYIAPEGMFILYLYRKYGSITKWSPSLIENFYNDLWKEERLEEWWDLSPRRLLRALQKLGPDTSFEQLCTKVYRQQAAVHGKGEVNCLGDKNPSYTLFIDQLARIFPTAKFIFLVRDYRDNILSFQKRDFDLSNTAALAERWVAYNKVILSYYNKWPERSFLLTYEALLQQSAKKMEEVCQFLNVTYRPAMLEFYKDQAEVKRWQQNLKNPIDPGQAYKWKKNMDSTQQAIAESICGKLGEVFGYERQNTSLSRGQQIKIMPARGQGRLANILERLFFWLPLPLKSFILHLYRRKTKSLDKVG